MGDRILVPIPFGNVHKKLNKIIFGHLVKIIPRRIRKLSRTYLKTAAAPSLKRQADATAPRAFMQCVLKQGSNGGVKQFDTGISAFDRNRGWGGVKKDLLDRGQKLKIVKSLPEAHGAGHQK